MCMCVDLRIFGLDIYAGILKLIYVQPVKDGRTTYLRGGKENEVGAEERHFF